MPGPIQRRTDSARLGRAFTVVELLVAVSIMTLIVLVLYGVFDQVQKALRGNSSQVDVLEGGRAAIELMTREMEQMQASRVVGATNLWVSLTSAPTRQEMLDPNTYRTNVLQEIYFLSHFNKDWTGVGYRVVSTNYGVGSLFRFSISTNARSFTDFNLSSNYLQYASPRYSNVCQRVTDGIVHFRVRAFDTNGFPVSWRDWQEQTNAYYASSKNGNLYVTNKVNGITSDETSFVFRADLLPAFLEVELGILEPRILEKYKSMANFSVATNFLAKQTGKVHLYQQRIPLRTAQ